MAEASWLWILLLALLPGAGPADPSAGEPGGGTSAGLAAEIRAELDRLRGHGVVVAGGGYEIEDIAGEGEPVVGVVERRGRALWLVSLDGRAYRLAGLLARPRFAGPGYKIWALGPVSEAGGERVLTPRRMGVLASPR